MKVLRYPVNADAACNCASCAATRCLELAATCCPHRFTHGAHCICGAESKVKA